MTIVGKGKREVNQFGKVLSDFKHGYINQKGKLIIPIKYDLVDDFSEGLAHVKPSLWEDVWFDKTGKVIIHSSDFPRAESFRGNMAYVVVAHVHKGFGLDNDYDRKHNPFDVRGNYIDHQGRLLVPWKYDTIAPYYSGYSRPVRKKGKWGFVDSSASLVVAMQYDDVDEDSTFFWQHLRRVGVGEQFGFINPKNGQLVVPIHYEDSKPSQSAFVWVRKQGKWGCLTERGKLVIPFQ